MPRSLYIFELGVLAIAWACVLGCNTFAPLDPYQAPADASNSERDASDAGRDAASPDTRDALDDVRSDADRDAALDDVSLDVAVDDAAPDTAVGDVEPDSTCACPPRPPRCEGDTTAVRDDGAGRCVEGGGCDYSDVETRETCQTGVCLEGSCDVTRVEPGDYYRGAWCNDWFGLGEGDEDLHRVRLTRPFALQNTEVTQAQWRAVMGSSPAEPADMGSSPVNLVSWWDALSFLNALSRRDGLEPCYDLVDCFGQAGSGCVGRGNMCDAPLVCCDGDFVCEGVRFFAQGAQESSPDPAAMLACEGWRLPTEAEWEYAARAGSTSVFANGDIDALAARAMTCEDGSCLDLCWDIELQNTMGQVGWYCGNAQGPNPVATLAANAWGLYDMHGNVSEWVWDWFAPYPEEARVTLIAPDACRAEPSAYTDPVNVAIDPTGPDAPVPNPADAQNRPFRVQRGGAWYDIGISARSANRCDNCTTPRGRNILTGFRAVRTLLP